MGEGTTPYTQSKDFIVSKIKSYTNENEAAINPVTKQSHSQFNKQLGFSVGNTLTTVTQEDLPVIYASNALCFPLAPRANSESLLLQQRDAGCQPHRFFPGGD